jgi:RNA polymerase sigma-70 factor (ECF subfamily)
MSSNPSDDESRPHPTVSAAQFATTHWSTVLAAGDSALPGSREALERLCRTYWYPLYAFVRRKGHSPEDAKDLTQAFFERFLRP